MCFSPKQKKIRFSVTTAKTCFLVRPAKTYFLVKISKMCFSAKRIFSPKPQTHIFRQNKKKRIFLPKSQDVFSFQNRKNMFSRQTVKTNFPIKIAKMCLGKKLKPNRTNPTEVKPTQTKSCYLYNPTGSFYTQPEWLSLVWI